MKPICYNCQNYYVSEDQTRESCKAFIPSQTKFTMEVTKPYIKERMLGIKNFCKMFKKI